MPTVIIQSSFPRTGSTFLVNALYGMVAGMHDQPVCWDDLMSGGAPPILKAGLTIIKTHNTNLEEIVKMFPHTTDLYFVCSERGAMRFNDYYRNFKNVVIFNYDELNETITLSLKTIVDNIYKKLSRSLTRIMLNKSNAYMRLQMMNERYKEIEYEPFDYTDPFYNLHGSHRRRPKLRGTRR